MNLQISPNDLTDMGFEPYSLFPVPYFPLFSSKDELGQIINSHTAPEDGKFMILPVQGPTPFEGMKLILDLGNPFELDLCKEAHNNRQPLILGVAAERCYDGDPTVPLAQRVLEYGCIGYILQISDNPLSPKVAVYCGPRVRLRELEEPDSANPFLCNVEFCADSSNMEELEKEESKEKLKKVSILFQKMLRLIPVYDSRRGKQILDTLPPMLLLNFISMNYPCSMDDKYDLLISDVPGRLELLSALSETCIENVKVHLDLIARTGSDINQRNRENYLRTQMQAIRDELGDSVDEQTDIDELAARAQKKNWSPEAKAHFEKELKKLNRFNVSMPEYSIQYNYLDLLLNLPWEDIRDNDFTLQGVRDTLDKDHFGLEKIKQRIVEHMAVHKLRGDMKAPILCLYGPPGVGKTSLGRSIAESLGRDYQRISLGGVSDEAEIRGHRRTYVGAMAGRVMTAMAKCGHGNPVVVLDEIDKIGQGVRGNPAHALLEVLDPEQNTNFHDNYVDFDYDLSKVFFIATANSLSTISQPLLDRMEIIELTGYIEQEKIEIAIRHLIPKALEKNGLKKKDVTFTPEGVAKIINSYTRESGVRQLEKKISSLLRKIACLKVEGKRYKKTITPDQVVCYLGKEEVYREDYEDNSYAGVVTGLAWTAAGGEILFIETSVSKGKGDKLTLTGNLGDVMKESASIALEYLKSHYRELGFPEDLFKEKDIHIHVPEGAVPKDGPSAGVTMATSLASALTRRQVRDKLAMTGEITLRGKVLPVGGIKEKILAARRAGITDIMLSNQNRKDVEEIPQIYLEGLTFHYVERVEEVISFALLDTEAPH